MLLDIIKRTVIWVTFQNISYECCKLITIFTFCILHAYTCVSAQLAVSCSYVQFINVFIRSFFQILFSFLFVFFFFCKSLCLCCLDYSHIIQILTISCLLFHVSFHLLFTEFIPSVTLLTLTLDRCNNRRVASLKLPPCYSMPLLKRSFRTSAVNRKTSSKLCGLKKRAPVMPQGKLPS